MEKSKIPRRNKYAKITNFAFTQFMIIFFAGGIFSIGMTLRESSKEGSIVLMLISAGLFAWSILRQARSTMATEKIIENLEQKIENLAKKN